MTLMKEPTPMKVSQSGGSNAHYGQMATIATTAAAVAA